MKKVITDKGFAEDVKYWIVFRALLVALSLFLVCFFASASSNTIRNQTKDEVLNTYLNAVIHGKIDGISDSIDEDARFDLKRGENVNTLYKPQILNALKSGENIEQDCQYTKTVLQDDNDISILKVEMKYNDFARIEVITAQRAGAGWKITKVETSFK